MPSGQNPSWASREGKPSSQTPSRAVRRQAEQSDAEGASREGKPSRQTPSRAVRRQAEQSDAEGASREGLRHIVTMQTDASLCKGMQADAKGCKPMQGRPKAMQAYASDKGRKRRGRRG